MPAEIGTGDVPRVTARGMKLVPPSLTRLGPATPGVPLVRATGVGGIHPSARYGRMVLYTLRHRSIESRGFKQGIEDLGIERFDTLVPAEGFVVTVPQWASPPIVGDFHFKMTYPFSRGLCCDLQSAVVSDVAGCSATHEESSQSIAHVLMVHPPCLVDHYALAPKFVADREHP